MKKLIFLMLIWYAIGVHGFIHWWTTDHDFTNEEVTLAMVIGLTGPFAHVIGSTIHGEPVTPYTIIIPTR